MAVPDKTITVDRSMKLHALLVHFEIDLIALLRPCSVLELVSVGVLHQLSSRLEFEPFWLPWLSVENFIDYAALR